MRRLLIFCSDGNVTIMALFNPLNNVKSLPRIKHGAEYVSVCNVCNICLLEYEFFLLCYIFSTLV